MKSKMFLAAILLLALLLPLTANGGSESGSAAETPELIWIMGLPGQVPVDQVAVEEVLDEISMAEVGVTVKTLYYDNERTLLALAAGEIWDMTFTCGWFNNFAVQARSGYFADITDDVQSMTPDLYATMPEVVWEGAKVDGKILAIPVKKDYAAEVFWRFDKELFVDQLGMNPPQLPKDDMDFFAIEEYLAAAKKAYEDGLTGPEGQYPFMLKKTGMDGADALFDMINRDAMLGIPYSAQGSSSENKVVLTVESPDLYDRFVALHRWYEAGYINKDAAAIEDLPKYSAVKLGQGFYGADAIWSGGDGYTQTISRMSGPYLSTASIRGSMNAISAETEYQAEALKYMELVNTNQEYRDILRYGVEGTHWDRTSDGLVKKTETGTQKYNPWPFSQGSYSLSSVQAADGVDVDPDMWKVIFDGYADLTATHSIGFSFDIEPVADKIAAIKVIKEKYWGVLATGTVDPAVEVPNMIDELEAAGIREVQAECQRQFDTFLAQ